MKIEKIVKMIANKADLKTITKSIIVGTIPGMIRNTILHSLQGNFYGAYGFSDLSTNELDAIRVFTKSDCKPIKLPYNLISNMTQKNTRISDGDWAVTNIVVPNVRQNARDQDPVDIIAHISNNGSIIFNKNVIQTVRDNSHRVTPFIFIIGPNFRKDLSILRRYHKVISDYRSANTNEVNHRIDVYHYNENGMNGTQHVIKPDAAIFSDQRDDIIREVDNVMYKFAVADKFIIPATSAILLHGVPGTGKSLMVGSMIAYITNKYRGKRISTTYIEPGAFRSKDASVSQILSNITGRNNEGLQIIVIEDCDLVMSSRQAKKKEDEEKTKLNITIDLLRWMDNGLQYNNPLLIIMTTNHPDKLDDALLRPGRTDANIEVTNICTETAEKMCEHYGLKYTDVNTPPDASGLINPATLQRDIISKLSSEKPFTKEKKDKRKGTKPTDAAVTYEHKLPHDKKRGPSTLQDQGERYQSMDDGFPIQMKSPTITERERADIERSHISNTIYKIVDELRDDSDGMENAIFSGTNGGV
jgi:hypothetical protein